MFFLRLLTWRLMSLPQEPSFLTSCLNEVLSHGGGCGHQTRALKHSLYRGSRLLGPNKTYVRPIQRCRTSSLSFEVQTLRFILVQTRCFLKITLRCCAYNGGAAKYDKNQEESTGLLERPKQVPTVHCYWRFTSLQ